MDHSPTSVYSSKPVEFSVEDQTFVMHSALIANISRPLERYINGEMREAKDGRVYLKEVDSQTFARFCDWAYSGYYMVQDFSKRSRSLEKIDDDEILLSTPKRDLVSKKMKKSTSVFDGMSDELPRREALKSDFLGFRYGTVDDERSTWIHYPDKKPLHNCTSTLLSHARLYVFAEKFDIQQLKILTLRNLHQTLTNFALCHDSIDDLVKLLAFVYDNTALDHNGEEPMRTMLCQYIGFEMDRLLEATAFRDLLKQSGDFVDDFCKQVTKRIEN